jgi:hypothetical protein
MKIIIILLLIIIVIFFLYKIVTKENFNLNKETIIREVEINEQQNNLIYRIIPSITDFTSLIDPEIVQNTLSNYLGIYIPDKGSVDNNLIYTRSLNSNNWYGPLQNALPAPNTIITQLTYNNDKRLMCIGISTINNKKEHTIFIKETTDILSNWVKLKQNNSIYNSKISYILYDIYTNKLIGINHEDGQLYIKETSDTSSIWVGPINFDTPMKAIYYYKNNFMIGIGRDDNFIYTKNGSDWTKNKWDNNNINRTYVYDLLLDLDGRLIATTPNGILKQTTVNLFSQFVPINNITTHMKRTIRFNDSMYYKTGCKIFDTTKIAEKSPFVQNILDKKKKVLKSCKNIRYLKDNTISDETDNIITDNFNISRNINYLLNKLQDKL